jgi:pimeloyl-ACP methyl ester carboxylesterase
MLQTDNKYITLSGYKHRYIDCGQGDTSLILIHGMSSSLEIFEKSLPVLSKHMRVLALDLLGFGQSDKPHTENYTLEFYANLIREFILNTDCHGPDKQVVVLGHSMGGKYALTLSLNYPELVQKVVLSNSDGFIHVPHVIRAASFWGIRHVLHKMISRRNFVENAMKKVYHDPSHITKDHLELNLKMARDKQIFRTIMLLNKNFKKLDLKRTGYRDRLPELQKPVLIIWGQQDQFLSPKSAHLAEREIQNSELHIIPNCGHAPMVEKSDIFTKLIIDFVSKPTG